MRSKAFLEILQQTPGSASAKREVNEIANVTVELYVTNSEPAVPGSTVDVCRVENQNKVIIGKAKVLHVRWKVSGPFTAPRMPAEGFVTLSVTPELSKQLETDDVFLVNLVHNK